MSVDIRSAMTTDAARCAEIYSPYVTDSWVSFELDPPDTAEMARRITTYSASHVWLIAEMDGVVVGYVYGSRHRMRQAYATSADVAVYVDSAFVRNGIGKQLYEALFPALKARGVHAVFAGIALPNEASIALHEAMGMTPVGVYREVGWKMNGWRDVGWWQRLL